MTESALTSIEDARLAPEDIAFVIPHQANIRIIESAMKRLDIPMEKAVSVLHKTGEYVFCFHPASTWLTPY